MRCFLSHCEPLVLLYTVPFGVCLHADPLKIGALSDQLARAVRHGKEGGLPRRGESVNAYMAMLPGPGDGSKLDVGRAYHERQRRPAGARGVHACAP